MSALASGSDLLAHLVVESELFGLVNDTLLACQAYRAESTFSGILLERYYRELGHSVKDLDRFRRTIRQKLCGPVRSRRASMADVPFAPGSAQLAVSIDPVVLRQSLVTPILRRGTSYRKLSHYRWRHMFGIVTSASGASK